MIKMKIKKFGKTIKKKQKMIDGILKISPKAKKKFKLELKNKSKLTKKKKKEKIPKKQKVFFVRFSVKDQAIFIKRLSFLIRSGVPILEGLKVLHSQSRSARKKIILGQLVKDVSNGQSLSDSMAKFGKIFSPFTVNIIKIGELSGNLSNNLNYLAEELTKKQALRRKVISALIYPAFITIATISVATLLTVYIFPKIMPIFLSLDVNLPITTRVLLFVSNFLQDFGLYLLGVLILLTIGWVIIYPRTPFLKKLLARIILRLPVFGGLVKSYNMTDFCRTFSLLLKSGFAVTDASSVTSESTYNPIYSERYLQMKEHIIKGERISTHLEESPHLFPEMVTHLVMIGETSGNLSDTMHYLSEHYEGELDDKIKNLSNSIEPALMIFMGIVVGFVAISVITPIYEITQTLSR